MDDTRRQLKESHCGVDRKLQEDDASQLLHHRNKHSRRKEFNASLVAADCWLYCTQQPGFLFGANLWGLCGTRGCVGSSLGVCKGVALVKRRVSAFAMYRIGLAGPRHCSVMRCGTI